MNITQRKLEKTKNIRAMQIKEEKARMQQFIPLFFYWFQSLVCEDTNLRGLYFLKQMNKICFAITASLLSNDL